MDTTTSEHVPVAPARVLQSAFVPREAKGIRRILVCLDRSPLSEVCLPYATLLAKTFGSDITLLHVMQPMAEHGGQKTTDPLVWEIARREVESYMGKLGEETERSTGRPVETRIEQGHPAERIGAFARTMSADLTVLGRHGAGGMTGWQLGSTAQQVLGVTRASVLLTRSSGAATTSVVPRKILVPLDGSVRTESVLPTAARIAKEHGAELLLVHVVAEPVSTAMQTDADFELARALATRLEAGANRYLARLVEQMTHDVKKVTSLVLRNVDRSETLLLLAQEQQVDLVVLSAHGSTCNPGRAFGGMAMHLLAQCTVPLLVLQDLPVVEAEPKTDSQAPPMRASFAPADS